MNTKVLACALPLTLLATGDISICSSDSILHQQVDREKSVVPSMIMTPEIPNQVSFCGKLIDVTRYNMHEGIDRELTSFCYLHATTMLSIKRANRYFPIIEPILKANGVPDDFKYLAVIESHLDPQISSPARALGMWQFMETTAREYGLTVTPTVDERCNVEKATVAACKYLKSAYAKYGDWASVASSYNAGMGRISGEMNKQNVDSSFDLWLVEETTRYVYRILAIKLIFENPQKYGFILRARDLYKPLDCKNVEVKNDIENLASFAKKYNVTYADLRRINPWLKDRKLTTGGKRFNLQIPTEDFLHYTKPNEYVHNAAWIAR